MKRIFSLILCILLICSMTCAYALNWTDVTETDCTEYTLTAEKYEKVEGDVGASYKKSPNATAKIGDTVYFDISAVDTNGMEVAADIEYHNLGDVEPVGKIFKAKVVGSKPYVRISVTEKTSIDELFYKGQNIIVDESEVMIGNLVFMRDENGIVRDVYHYGNYAEMIDDLFELGIDVADVYDGKIKMTDDILISNFGKECNTEAVAAWYVAAESEVLGIPKTGDMTVTGIVLMVLCLFGAVMLIRKGMHCKR